MIETEAERLEGGEGSHGSETDDDQRLAHTHRRGSRKSDCTPTETGILVTEVTHLGSGHEDSPLISSVGIKVVIEELLDTRIPLGAGSFRLARSVVWWLRRAIGRVRVGIYKCPIHLVAAESGIVVPAGGT